MLNFIRSLIRRVRSSPSGPAAEINQIIIHDTTAGEGYTWKPPEEWVQNWEIVGPNPFEGLAEYADDVRAGDLVWVDRRSPGRSLIRIMTPSSPASPGEVIYRVERGNGPGSIRLVAVGSG